MKNFPTFLLVVAALIRDRAGRVLLQRGLPGKRHAGLWELPGGKVEADELPRDALIREVAEELSIALHREDLAPAGFAEEAAEGMRPALVLILYKCEQWTGEPRGLEQQEWGWFTLDEIASMPLAPMDRELMDAWLAAQK